MKTFTIPRDVVESLLSADPGREIDGFVLIRVDLVDVRRWGVVYNMIVTHGSPPTFGLISWEEAVGDAELPPRFPDPLIEADVVYPHPKSTVIFKTEPYTGRM